jgi:molybdopterin-binding protein
MVQSIRPDSAEFDFSYSARMTLLTVRQAAARVGVGYSTFKHWIYQGAVRTTRTRGGHHRVPVSEVDRLLADEGGLPDHSRPPKTSVTPTIVALSTRNQLRGVVEEVRSEGVLAQVRLRVGDHTITAVITRDAVNALGLRRGQPAIALIKSTEVMIGTEPDSLVEGRGQKARTQKPRVR